MGYLALGVTSTAAEGTARLIDRPTLPVTGLAISVDPLIVLAAITIALVVIAARWGGLFQHAPT